MIKPRVVLDTNVLLVSISSKSKYHWIFDSLLNHQFDLFITNEILSEYEEIISEKWSPIVAKYVISTLLELKNVHATNVYFNLNLIEHDPDDNKFTDCAFAANADFIVSHDQDFDILKHVDFPKINVIPITELKTILERWSMTLKHRLNRFSNEHWFNRFPDDMDFSI